MRDAAFRQAGITFTVYGEGEGVERTFPMDLVPRIIPADEWAHLEEGLVQRVTALNRFLDDLYVGDQAALNDGIIPRWLVTSSDGFQREAFGIAVPHGARCLVAGIDIVRDDQGTYRVLEDNLRNPSGVSYVLENRAAMTRVLPRVFDDHLVRPVDHYGPSLLGALRRVSPAGADPSPPWSSSRPACTTPPTSSTPSSLARWASSWSRAATSWWTTTSCRCARPTA